MINSSDIHIRGDSDGSIMASQIQPIAKSGILIQPVESNYEQQSTLSQPGLPTLNLEEQIRLDLLKLAESNPTEIQLELNLKQLAKNYKVGMKALRKTYDEVKTNYLIQQEEASTVMTEEEKSAKAEAEEADKQWKEKISERAQQIASSTNITDEFIQALLQCCNYIAGEKEATTILLTHIFRLLQNSMGCVIYGTSGSGKSDLVEKSAQFLPPEIVVRYTSFSNQAISYLGSLEHKYILGGELKVFKPGEDDSFQHGFRQLISENRITRVVTERKPSGEFETHTYETKGPATFIMTTTREQTNFNDEFVNRLSWTTTSDDPQCTEAVLKLQAQVASSPPDEAKRRNNQLEIEAWREFHRRLQPLIVEIPYAKKIVPTSKDVTARRLFHLLLNYIKASALLNQQKREIINKGQESHLKADRSDYIIAYNLIMENAPRVLDMVSKPCQKTYNKLLTYLSDCQKVEFTRADAQQNLHIPLGTIKRHLSELKEAGCLELTGKDGKTYIYKVVADLPPLYELNFVNPNRIDNWEFDQ